ncbi:MAG: DUF2752 domain-containing protein [Pirellulales bacterium]
MTEQTSTESVSLPAVVTFRDGGPKRWFLRFLVATASALSVVYVIWNIYWLTQRRLAPSLFSALTGLPCPTTGGTRSLRCLLAGEWAEACRYNLFTLPIIGLLAYSIAAVVYRGVMRRSTLFGDRLLYAWMGMLAIAWIAKLCGDPAYW